MKVVVAHSKNEVLDNIFVRGQVFIIGQNIDWEIEFDGLDQESVLFNAYIDNQIAGVARLYKNKVGRVATLEQFRNKGVARAIMLFIEQYATENGYKELKLNAQLHVKEFYDKLGYESIGDVFLEADIEHITMIKYI